MALNHSCCLLEASSIFCLSQDQCNVKGLKICSFGGRGAGCPCMFFPMSIKSPARLNVVLCRTAKLMQTKYPVSFVCMCVCRQGYMECVPPVLCVWRSLRLSACLSHTCSKGQCWNPVSIGAGGWVSCCLWIWHQCIPQCHEVWWNVVRTCASTFNWSTSFPAPCRSGLKTLSLHWWYSFRSFEGLYKGFECFWSTVCSVL